MKNIKMQGWIRESQNGSERSEKKKKEVKRGNVRSEMNEVFFRDDK
jgi:hypothetical protein